MASKICKIVYFDEDSVTDYVQIVAGGTLEKTTELLNSSDLSEEQKADLSNPPAQIQECAAHARTDQQQAGFQNSG